MIKPAVTSKSLVVRVEYNPVFTSIRDTNAVISEALIGMEVEDKNQSSPIKYNHFVALIFGGHVAL